MIAPLAVVVVGYLLGSLPTGLLLVRVLSGVDIRQHGSRNTGAVNVYRVAGPATAAVVLAVDVLKGAVPVVIARHVAAPSIVAVTTGLAAIVGHNWSIFLQFTGGKGIATSFGVTWALSPLAGLIALVIWGGTVALTRYASLGSLLGIASIPLVTWWHGEPVAHTAFGVIALALALYRHRANIARLAAGTELKIADRGT